jgi:hypothetical protein
MNWLEIKNSIRESLNSRGLANPNIRINALNRIEEILKRHYPKFIQNPQEEFGRMKKSEFKALIEKCKNADFSGAESSVINEIYYRI